MIYSYKFMPSVMHRIESLLIALNLKKNIPKVNIPTIKVQLQTFFDTNHSWHFHFLNFFLLTWWTTGSGSYHNEEVPRPVPLGITRNTWRLFSEICCLSASIPRISYSSRGSSQLNKRWNDFECHALQIWMWPETSGEHSLVV